MEQPDYDKVKARLAFLSNLYNGLTVQTFRDYPCPWIKYDDSPEFNDYVMRNGYPNHREITKYEIVIDVDSDTYEDGVKHADLIEERFRKKEYAFTRYYSGGTGQHFHLLFKRRQINELLKKYFLGEIKRHIIIYIVGDDLLKPKDINSHVCLVDKKLIQIEWMLHRKGNIKKKISTLGGMSVQNEVPDAIFNKLERNRVEKADRKERIKQKLLAGRMPEMNCIRYILGEEINGQKYENEVDGLYRSSFLLIAHYVRQGLDHDEIYEKMKEWYNKVPEDLKKKCLHSVNLGKIKYALKTNNGAVGCNYAMTMLEDIGKQVICANCPYL